MSFPDVSPSELLDALHDAIAASQAEYTLVAREAARELERALAITNSARATAVREAYALAHEAFEDLTKNANALRTAAPARPNPPALDPIAQWIRR